MYTCKLIISKINRPFVLVKKISSSPPNCLRPNFNDNANNIPVNSCNFR